MKLQAREGTESGSAHRNKSMPTDLALSYQNLCPSDQTSLLQGAAVLAVRTHLQLTQAELSSTPPIKALIDISPPWPRLLIIPLFSQITCTALLLRHWSLGFSRCWEVKPGNPTLNGCCLHC